MSTFFASLSLSTNSIIAIGASSPVLKPAFKTLEYPPFLLLYLSESTLKTFLTDANNAGLEVGRIVNYLPRGFNYRAVQKELENFKKGIDGELVKEGKITTDKINELFENYDFEAQEIKKPKPKKTKVTT